MQDPDLNPDEVRVFYGKRLTELAGLLTVPISREYQVLEQAIERGEVSSGFAKRMARRGSHELYSLALAIEQYAALISDPWDRRASDLLSFLVANLEKWCMAPIRHQQLQRANGGRQWKDRQAGLGAS